MCFGPKQQGPLIVSAGGTIAIDCELDLHKTGPFEVEVDIHVEENGIRTIPLMVRGVAVAAPGNGHAGPPKP
jgi:hypothetical protein